MSWEPIAPRGAVSKISIYASAVTVAVTRRGRFAQRMIVVVRPEHSDGQPTWWKHGARVDVELGRDEHAGRLRIQEGRSHELSKGNSGKSGRSQAAMLSLPAPATTPEAGRKAAPAQWEILGDALIITLPWTDAKGACKADPTLPPQFAQPQRVPWKALDLAPPLRRSVVPEPKPHVVVPTTPKPAATAPVVAPKPKPQTPKPAPFHASPEQAPPRREPVLWPYMDIARYAASVGLWSETHGFDLAKVNERRLRDGRFPLKIRPSKAKSGPATAGMHT